MTVPTVANSLWFGLAVWHIKQCWLFNAKSCFYTKLDI